MKKNQYCALIVCLCIPILNGHLKHWFYYLKMRFSLSLSFLIMEKIWLALRIVIWWKYLDEANGVKSRRCLKAKDKINFLLVINWFLYPNLFSSKNIQSILIQKFTLNTFKSAFFSLNTPSHKKDNVMFCKRRISLKGIHLLKD